MQSWPRKRGARSSEKHPQDLDVGVGVQGPQTHDGISVLMDRAFTIRSEQLRLQGVGVYLEQLADNFGLTDEDRARNYLASCYNLSPEALGESGEKHELTTISVLNSRLSTDNRRIVSVICTFKSSGTKAPKEIRYFVRVDVTDEFPSIVTPWRKYLKRE